MNLLESLKYLVGLKPETVAFVSDGTNNEQFIFQPVHNTYIRVKSLLQHKHRERQVSNAEALLEVVVEEAKRLGNNTGAKMTVIFDGNGGMFYTDDSNRYNQDTWAFKRKLSAEFQSLCQYTNDKGPHVNLLEWMGRIQTSVVDFGAVHGAMRRMRVDKKVEITSQPHLVDGKTGNSVKIDFRISGENGGAGSVSIPSEFTCRFPVISMSSKFYEVTVEVDSWLDDKTLLFSLRCSNLAAIQQQAILEEVTEFKAKAKAALPDLLVVTDM